MTTQPITLADLVAGASEERCLGCPPDRVCAWACKQGFSVTDSAALAMLEIPLGFALDADIDAIRQALCDCYN